MTTVLFCLFLTPSALYSLLSFSNDNRFAIAYYTDDSFRPSNDESLCVGPSRTETVDGNFVVEFNTCSGGGGATTSNHQKWTPFRSSRRFLTEEDRVLQEECTDEPLGWYDTYGKLRRSSSCKSYTCRC